MDVSSKVLLGWMALATFNPALSQPAARDLTTRAVPLQIQSEQGQAKDSDKKPASVIRPGDLSELIQKADKLVVYANEAQQTTIFRSTRRKDLDELSAAIVIQAGEGVACACLGAPMIALFREGKQIGFLTNQSAHAIGTSLWDMDAVILDPQKWLHWFDARGIKGPRREFKRRMAEARQSLADEERWMKAMPASMREPWEKNKSELPYLNADIRPLTAALEKEIPEKPQRIRALLGLFGSGAGPWSGYPGYEGAVEDMLMEYSTADLLAAITGPGASLTNEQIEGAARLFASWNFGQQRPQDRTLLPADLKRMLLEHSLKSRDGDKLGRAKRAFAN